MNNFYVLGLSEGEELGFFWYNVRAGAVNRNTEYIVWWPSEVVHLYTGFPTLGWDGAKKP